MKTPMNSIKRIVFFFIASLFCITFVNAQEADKIGIAVSDLVPAGIKESDALIVSEQLREELMKSSNLRMIERSQMQEILKEQGFQQTGCTNDECAVEIGQLLGVKNMAVGTLGLGGSYTVLSVRVLDVGTGEILVNESIRTKGGIDKLLETGIKTLTQSLLQKLFPDIAAAKSKTGKNISTRKSRFNKAVAIGSCSAVAVGAATAAIFVYSKNEKESHSNDPNITVEFP
jgi:hypothetical protein